MPTSKDRVQFQRGQSLRAFLKRCGTDDQCVQALFQARWPQAFRCPDCGYHEHCLLRRRKALQCIRCKQQTSLVAGTVFENNKLGVSYNSAMQTMREREDSQPLRGIVELDDAYLGGETGGGKRRRGTALPWKTTIRCPRECRNRCAGPACSSMISALGWPGPRSQSKQRTLHARQHCP